MEVWTKYAKSGLKVHKNMPLTVSFFQIGRLDKRGHLVLSSSAALFFPQSL